MFIHTLLFMSNYLRVSSYQHSLQWGWDRRVFPPSLVVEDFLVGEGKLLTEGELTEVNAKLQAAQQKVDAVERERNSYKKLGKVKH